MKLNSEGLYENSMGCNEDPYRELINLMRVLEGWKDVQYGGYEELHEGVRNGRPVYRTYGIG